MRPFDFLEVLMAFSPLECRVLWIGYLVGQLLRGPQTLLCDALQSLERWARLPIFFTGRFDVGQDVFPEQWLLVSSFKDPCLHLVVDISLLLMVLSVPASSQIFLEVAGACSRGTYPAFNSGCPVPFPPCRFLAMAGETMPFLPHVL